MNFKETRVKPLKIFHQCTCLDTPSKNTAFSLFLHDLTKNFTVDFHLFGNNKAKIHAHEAHSLQGTDKDVHTINLRINTMTKL